MSDVETRMAALEARLHTLEDQLALYQLISAYGPLVDSGDAEATSNLWVEDGVYDWGGGAARGPGGGVKEGPDGAAHSRAEIAAMVRGKFHQDIIGGGSAHVIGLPFIVFDGDRAVATTYARLYRKDGENFRIWRVSASRWECVRTAEGWRIQRRINRVLTGADEPRQLLRAGIAGGTDVR